MLRPDFVLPADSQGEFYTAERCYIMELFNTPDCPHSSIARARVKPGVTTQLHSLTGVREVYVIESGEGIVEIDGKQARVAVGDRVDIPAGTPQRITNTGKGDLIFLCLCVPRFTPENYQNLETAGLVP